MFLRARVLRLVPAAWLCATLTALLLSADGDIAHSAARWIRSVLFIPFGTQVDPSYWTLGIEVTFYLLVALSLHTQISKDAGDSLAAILSSWSLVFWLCWLLSAPDNEGLSTLRFGQLLLLPHGCFFAAGILIARVQECGWSRKRLMVATATAVGCVVEVVAHTMERARDFGFMVEPALPLSLVCGGVLFLAFAERLQPALERLIGAERARQLGLATYPLYLIHQEAGASVTGWLARAGLRTEAALILAGALMMLVAGLIAQWAEPTIRAQLGHVLDFHFRVFWVGRRQQSRETPSS